MERKTEEEEEDMSLKVVPKEEGVTAVSNYSGEEVEELKEEKGEVEASTVVNYSKEEVKELLRKKTEVEVGKVILVNYRPAVFKKRKVKVGKRKQRWRYTNRRRKSKYLEHE